MLMPHTNPGDDLSLNSAPLARRQVVLVLFFAVVLLGNQLQNEVLYSVDGIVYTLIGKELARRPLTEWALLTWNGQPFFEHPPLTPWLLALSIRWLGVSTFAVLLPIALLSVATTYLAYRLGRVLLDHRLGLLTAIVLVLTPEFVRGGRNPMLEPALMFFVMLAVYCHVESTRPQRFVGYSLMAAVSVGLALLAKGPPALLALGVIGAFQAAAWSFPRGVGGFRLPARKMAVQAAMLLLIPTAVALLFDLWSRHVAGESFIAHYVSHQLDFTIVQARGAVSNDWTYYLRTFIRYWPWWPFVLAGIGVVAWQRDVRAVPALTIGIAVTGGTYLGFSAMGHKSEWYVAIHYVGSSLLAALALRPLLSVRILDRYFQRFVLGITIPLLLLSAIAPSVFLQYSRPFERFLDRAQVELRDTLAGEAVADCVGVEPWKGPFFLAFYLGTSKTECGDTNARYRLVDTRNEVMRDGERIVFSQQPFSIVSRPGAH
ncbi:MAG: glycosyltransferase family 39 protein [Vicinamibacterales bacterium]